MPRSLVFTVGEAAYDTAPTKVDRRKLYGWATTIAVDDAGSECRLASMDGSGTFIIPPGGTGLGVLGPDGEWVDRAQLRAVTIDGQDAPLLPSSFDGPIDLSQTATANDLLDHNIVSVYQLSGASGLADALGGRIASFEYCYRAGYVASDAFVLAADGEVFMLVGYKNTFEFVGLRQAEEVDEPDEPNIDDDDDDIDFSMF